MVDEKQIEGTALNKGGKVKDMAGGLMGDAGLQAQGKADQAAGAAQDTLGAAMESAGAWRDKVVAFTKNKPVAALLAAVAVGFVLRSLMQTSRR